MDKLGFLKDIERLAVENCLDADEVRLYLLLLANCRGSQQCEITYSVIKSAIGSDFTNEKLKKACQQLVTEKMIHIDSLIPDYFTREEFVLSYTILETRDH